MFGVLAAVAAAVWRLELTLTSLLRKPILALSLLWGKAMSSWQGPRCGLAVRGLTDSTGMRPPRLGRLLESQESSS
jgi:hypothetical protein